MIFYNIVHENDENNKYWGNPKYLLESYFFFNQKNLFFREDNQKLICLFVLMIKCLSLLQNMMLQLKLKTLHFFFVLLIFNNYRTGVSIFQSVSILMRVTKKIIHFYYHCG